jgi:hypothetical protein
MSIVCSIKECVCMWFLGRRRAHFYCSLCRVWLCVVGLSRVDMWGFCARTMLLLCLGIFVPTDIWCSHYMYSRSSLRWRYKQWLCVFFKKKIRANLGCHICVLSSMEIVRYQGRPASGELCIRGVRHQGRPASGASCIGGVMHKGS